MLRCIFLLLLLLVRFYPLCCCIICFFLFVKKTTKFLFFYSTVFPRKLNFFLLKKIIIIMGVIAYCLSMKEIKEVECRNTIINDELSARRRMITFFTLKLMISKEEEELRASPIAVAPTRSILRSRSSLSLPSPEVAAKKVSFSCATDMQEKFSLPPPVFCDVMTFEIDDDDFDETTTEDDEISLSPQSLSPRSPRSTVNMPAFSTLAYIKKLRSGMRL